MLTWLFQRGFGESGGLTERFENTVLWFQLENFEMEMPLCQSVGELLNGFVSEGFAVDFETWD